MKGENDMKHTKLAYIAFAVLMLALGASDAMRGIFSSIFMETFSLNANQIGWLVTISYAGNLFFLAVGGRLVDSLKRKTALILLTAIWMFSELLFVTTVSYPVLMIAMFIAMGSSTLLNTTLNLTTSMMFASLPGFLVNALFFVQGIGTSGSQSIIGNWATDISSWHTVCAVLLGIGVLFLLLLLPVKIDVQDTAKGDEEGNQEKPKISYVKLIKNPFFVLMVCMFGAYFIGEHGIMNWFTNYGIRGLQMSNGRAANMTALFYGGMTVGRLVLSPLVDKFGPRKMLLIFGTGGAILYTVSMLIGFRSLVLMCACGLLFSILYPTMVMMIPNLFGREIASTASGLVISVASLADILFNAAFGYAVDAIGFNISFWAMPGFTVVYAVLLMVFCTKAKKLDQKN